MTTHPIIGPATWAMMRAAADKIRATGLRVCTWCHGPISSGRITRCGRAACNEGIWQAYSWSRCRRLTLRRQPLCSCGKRATEVDHIVPVCLGGLCDQNNLRGLCHPCHAVATARLRKEGATYRA